MIEYGFVIDQGFAAIDRERRLAGYAYPSSELEVRARHHAADVAREMIAQVVDFDCPQPGLFAQVSEKLARAKTVGFPTWYFPGV